MKQIEIARMGALHVKLTQSLINCQSRIIYLVNFLNLTSGQPWTYVQVVRQQNELGIPKRTTVSVEPWDVLDKKKCKSEFPSYFLNNDEVISGHIIIANKFNEYFTKIGPNQPMCSLACCYMCNKQWSECLNLELLLHSSNASLS